MSKGKEYRKLINSVPFQMINKTDFLDNLEWYADNTKDISKNDYNNIFILYSFKEEYFKNEVIKRLSQKTILNAFNLIYED